MSTPRMVIVTLLALVLSALVAAVVPLLRPAPWAATVPVRVQPAGGEWATTPYVEDVLSRPVVTATFAAMLADPGLLRAATNRLGLSRSAAEVAVRQASGSALLLVTVTTRQRDDAAALAAAVVAEAMRYVDGLGSLYVLRTAVPGQSPHVGRQARHGAATVVLFTAVLLPTWLLCWWVVSTWPGSGWRYRRG